MILEIIFSVLGEYAKEYNMTKMVKLKYFLVISDLNQKI